MIFRELRTSEYELLKDFLYEAIFIPEGMNPPDKSIIEKPELAVYYESFGEGSADHCIDVDDKGVVVGAIWSRIMDDYGHVDDNTPSLAMAVYENYRGQGIGTQLLHRMLSLLRTQGYEKVSLSVQKENRAVNMYRRAGFTAISENNEEYLMVSIAETIL
jgi:ribosomal protein S18 acetylase RimI-like enzyme